MSPRRFPSMFQFALLFLVASFFLLASGCSPSPGSFPDDYSSAMQRVKEGADPLATLVALDQRYPKQLSLKREIAAMLIAKNEIAAAESYLDAIEKLAPARDAELNAAVSGVRARIALARGQWDESLALAEKAVRLDPADGAGAAFTEGRSLVALGRTDEASEVFKAAFSANGSKAAADDWMAYIAILSEEDPAEALAVFARYDTAFPYEPGLGLVESAIREKLGDMNGAVYAIFRDIEYARSLGAIDDSTASSRLDQVSDALKAKDDEAARIGNRAIGGCRAYLSGDWAGVRSALGKDAVDQNMARWLGMVADMHLQNRSMDQLKDYADLAGEFADLPSYWYHLTHSMERPSSGASAADIKRAAELCLDAAPEGPYAGEAGKSLAKAIGLAPECGSLLLTRRGIELLGARSVHGGGAEVLEPVYGLLSLDDNEYTLYALGMMKGLAADPFYRSVLSEKRKLARGRLLERLQYILSE